MTTSSHITRRSFLVAVVATGGSVAFGLNASERKERVPERSKEPVEVNAWVLVGPDNVVTVKIPQVELGQGTLTTITQLLAEELRLNPDLIRAELYDPTTNILRDNVYVWTPTLSSLSADRMFVAARVGAAQVRTMLLQAAAQRLQVDPRELEVTDAQIRHHASGRSYQFAQLASTAATLPIPLAEHVELTPRSQWRYIGVSVPRRDSLAKSNGTAIYGIDVQLPGMKYAAVRQCPIFQGRLKSFEATQLLGERGIRGVFKIEAGRAGLNEPADLGADDWGMDDAVAIVADGWWQADQAFKRLPIEWDSGKTKTFNSKTLAEDMRYALDRGGMTYRAEGDVDAALSACKTVCRAEYWFPFMEHATLEPMNCTALYEGDRLELWAPTQYADEAVRVAAHAVGTSVDKVKLHLTYVGGGYGRRISNDYVNQAAQVAKQMHGTAVKLLWSREETFRRGYYPHPAISRFVGGLDDQGRLLAWHCKAVFAKKFDQSYVAARIAQMIPNTRVEVATVDSPVPAGWMRGVGWTQFAWMTQGFLDELAFAAHRDPIEFQLSLLDESKLSTSMSDREYAVERIRAQRRVLEEVRTRSQWHRTMLPPMARGVAVSDFSYWSGYRTSATAAVVELKLDGHGWVKIERVVVVIDCGVVINPDIVTAQIEGSVGWALSNAFYSEITLKGGQVEQRNFNDYRILRINEMPRVESHILESPHPPAGVGEDAIPVTIGALVNAISAAMGVRVRSLPISHLSPLVKRSNL